jgi:hypothetical protein
MEGVLASLSTLGGFGARSPRRVPPGDHLNFVCQNPKETVQTGLRYWKVICQQTKIRN